MELLKIIKAFETKGFDVTHVANGRFVADFENRSLGFQLQENGDVIYVQHHISNAERIYSIEQLLNLISRMRTI